LGNELVPNIQLEKLSGVTRRTLLRYEAIGELESYVSPIGSSLFHPIDTDEATSSLRDIPWPMPQLGFLIGRFDGILWILIGSYLASKCMIELKTFLI
jgi:hypothetical protein